MPEEEDVPPPPRQAFLLMAQVPSEHLTGADFGHTFDVPGPDEHFSALAAQVPSGHNTGLFFGHCFSELQRSMLGAQAPLGHFIFPSGQSFCVCDEQSKAVRTQDPSEH